MKIKILKQTGRCSRQAYTITVIDFLQKVWKEEKFPDLISKYLRQNSFRELKTVLTVLNSINRQ